MSSIRERLGGAENSSVKHGPQQSVPEGMFDDSIKLVVWGHEHDCRIWPEKVEGKNYYITQPGSSVATSLAPGEAIAKYAFPENPRVLADLLQARRPPFHSRRAISDGRDAFEDGPALRDGRGSLDGDGTDR